MYSIIGVNRRYILFVYYEGFYQVIKKRRRNCINQRTKTYEVKKLKRSTLKNTPYDYLYESIVSYKLLPGQAIVEQEVSNLLGISRTPVREALKRLEAEGLVRHMPARGTFVADITTQDVEEIFELREMFEEMALKAAIEHIPDSEIVEIENHLNSLVYGETSPEEFYESDRMLHQVIVKYSRNYRMVHFLNTINSQLERLRRISAMTPKRLENSKTEHMEILLAIKERDIDKALKFLHSHLANVKKSTLDACEKVRYIHGIR